MEHAFLLIQSFSIFPIGANVGYFWKSLLSGYSRILKLSGHFFISRRRLHWCSEFNLYHEIGRIVESISVLEPIRFSLDMALGNYAARMYALSAHSLDVSEQKESLIESVLHYQYLIEKYQPSNTMSEEIYLSFCQAKEYVQQLIAQKYEQIKVYADFSDSEIEEFELPQQNYQIWCREKQLALSFRNIYIKRNLM